MNNVSETVDELLEARLDSKVDDVEAEKILISDFIAAKTQQTRKVLKQIVAVSEQFKKSLYYK